MHSIFYDLETTDRYPIGQILNYSFIVVDDAFSVVDELSGKSKVSRLELPSPEAILVNRVCLPEHQQEAFDFEHQMVARVDAFINKTLASFPQPIAFIGYNSSRFDLPFLRTVFIRNGFSPFYKGLIPKDLLFGVQKAFISHPDFQRRVIPQDGSKLSLSLETISRTFDLLTGEQSHESRDDVLLSIRLARMLSERFSVNSNLETYEASIFHQNLRGHVALRCDANYEDTLQRPVNISPFVCLDGDHRQALWIDLKRFEAGDSRRSVRWLSKQRHTFFLEDSKKCDDFEHWSTVAHKALAVLHGVTLKNFFERNNCDVELDIHRLDFSAIEAFGNSVKNRDKSLLSMHGRDAHILWTRYHLRDPHLSETDPRFDLLLKNYAEHRYGGAMLVGRYSDEAGNIERHETAVDRYRKIKTLKSELTDKESLRLLDGLETFYHNSPVFRAVSSNV